MKARRLEMYHPPFIDNPAVLTWISIYWFSRAGPTASLRIYFEADIDTAFSVPEPRPTIPLGLSSFPRDIMVFPKRWAVIQTVQVYS